MGLAVYIEEASAVAALISVAVLFRAIQFLKLTQGYRLAWFFIGAVGVTILHRVVLIVVAYSGERPIWMGLEQALYPVFLSSCHYLFIAGLVKVYQGLLKDVISTDGDGTLEQATDALRYLESQHGDAIIMTTDEGIIHYVNRGFYDTFGYARGSVVGTPIVTLVPDRYKEPHKAAFARARTTGKLLYRTEMPLHVLCADGEEMAVWISLREFTTDAKRRKFVARIRRRIEKV